MKRYIPPELKGMQTAPGFWPVLPAGAKRYSNKLLTDKQFACGVKRIDDAMNADRPRWPTLHLSKKKSKVRP